jgi:IclR family acetate operon transcriptional repressor
VEGRDASVAVAPDPDGGKPAQSIQGVMRALEVLDMFIDAETSTLGVTEIAQASGLSKAVVYRILSAFRAKGFLNLEPETHRYYLGPRILELGLSYLDRIDMRQVAKEAMVHLVEATDETATLSVRLGWSRVYIDQVTPNQDIKMVVQIGKPFPLHAGASSKALLASLEPDEIEEYLNSQELVPLTAKTPTDPDRIRAELALIRKRGYAFSFGERDMSAGSVAAPIRGSDGNVLGVISVSGPIERFRAESKQSAKLLVQAVDVVSAQLGYRPTAPQA